IFRDAWLCSETDRSGGWAAFAMAACRTESSRIRNGSSGNAACKGRTICDDGQDGSQGCARDRPVDPDGMVPAGTRKISRCAGDPGTPDRTQTASWATDRCGIEYPRDIAWFWAEGWPGHAKEFRGADPRVGCGSIDIGAHCYGNALGTIGFKGRVRKVTQGCAGNCA